MRPPLGQQRSLLDQLSVLAAHLSAANTVAIGLHDTKKTAFAGFHMEDASRVIIIVSAVGAFRLVLEAYLDSSMTALHDKVSNLTEDVVDASIQYFLTPSGEILVVAMHVTVVLRAPRNMDTSSGWAKLSSSDKPVLDMLDFGKVHLDVVLMPNFGTVSCATAVSG